MNKRSAQALLSSLALTAAGFAALAAPAPAAAVVAAPTTAERALQSAAGGGVKVVRGTDGVAHFVGTTAGKPARRPAGLTAAASPETVARVHLASYGALFGLSDQAHQLRTERVTPAAGGQQIVRFSQLMGGLPVVGGELSVALDKAGNLLSVNGETTRAAVTTSFLTSAATAAGIAIGSTAKADHISAATLSATQPQQTLYDPSLVGPGKQTGARSVWRVEVTSSKDAALRQLVLVDATLGSVALSFNQIAFARERHVCDHANLPQANGSNSCGSPPTYARSEGDAANAVAEVNKAYDYAGATYDFYNTQFGRDGIDGAGLPLISTVRYCPDPDCPDATYRNAFWDGSQMTYGDGYADADDVVAHELTHGVTQYTSNLLYYYESGAINESMSDVFGEFVDLTDAMGTDTAGVRWQLGEDLPSPGVVRDMKNPPAFGQPDKTSSTLWNSDWLDGGGVHIDSGVGNKAAYLITDGDTFNGTTVTGLGITKAAAIYYQTELTLTSGADYRDLANILPQSCTSLVGTKGITAADCTQVSNAVSAVQMGAYPVNDAPLPPAPATCPGTDVTRFSDDFNGTLAKWTQSGTWSTTGTYRPNPGAGNALFGPDLSTASDKWIETNSAIVVPYGKATYLRFDHAYSFDWTGPGQQIPVTYYDGGFVEVSTDNGSTWTTISVAGNGYNAKLAAPLSRSAFSGDSTDWITSQATLSAYAGRSIKLRLRIVSDQIPADSTAYGWWIDNLRVYSCAARPRSDYTGDGGADRAVWQPSTGNWKIQGLPDRLFGQSGDVPLAGDFTGDGKSDLAVYRPSNGTWNVRGQPAYAFGVAGDIPVAADYTGDGKADFAVWRPSTGRWYIRGLSSVVWGVSGDRPAVADYNAAGKAQVVIWRPSNHTYYIRAGGTYALGASGDLPVAADFDGDGHADVAVWNPTSGNWHINTLPDAVWGGPGDIPMHE